MSPPIGAIVESGWKVSVPTTDGKTLVLEVDASDTLSNVAAKLADKEGQFPDEARLVTICRALGTVINYGNPHLKIKPRAVPGSNPWA